MTKSRKATVVAVKSEIARLCGLISKEWHNATREDLKEACRSAEEHLRDLTAKDRRYALHVLHGACHVRIASGPAAWCLAPEVAGDWQRDVILVDMAMGDTVGGFFAG
jgi:prophage DNA circulation protein